MRPTRNNEGFPRARLAGLSEELRDSHKKYPLILWVHGGPSNRVIASAAFADYKRQPSDSILYSRVLYVNAESPWQLWPEGEAFTVCNRKDFGYGDLRDLLAGVDVVTKKMPIDPNRIGYITGWSYGGFMTMFAVTQTHRFRAAWWCGHFQLEELLRRKFTSISG